MKTIHRIMSEALEPDVYDKWRANTMPENIACLYKRVFLYILKKDKEND